MAPTAHDDLRTLSIENLTKYLHFNMDYRVSSMQRLVNYHTNVDKNCDPVVLQELEYGYLSHSLIYD